MIKNVQVKNKTFDAKPIKHNPKIIIRNSIITIVVMTILIAPIFRFWMKTQTLATTFGSIVFTGGNNDFNYPDYITTFHGYDIVSDILFNSSRIEEFYSSYDVVMIYRSKIWYGGDREWDFHERLARAYYRYGDFYNSLNVYDQIYSANGTADHFTPGGLHQYARLLISKERFEDAENLVNNDSGWEIVNYGIKHKILSITSYNKGQYILSFYHYYKYSYSDDYFWLCRD